MHAHFVSFGATRVKSAGPRARAIAALLLSLAAAAVSASEQWPTPPSRLQLPTPYGIINVQANEYLYESRLRVDDAEVEPEIRGILNITYAFETPKSQSALISINTGNNVCPFVYRWIVLTKSGYTVSPEFGSCSDQIRVSVSGRRLSMQTPNRQKPDKIDTYIYDGKTITRRASP